MDCPAFSTLALNHACGGDAFLMVERTGAGAEHPSKRRRIGGEK
jgi:hypothetical protein